MSKRDYTHKLKFRLRLTAKSDERAPGGAVTVGLCGHWDHDGPCRWPHLSSISVDEKGIHHLLVEFDAPMKDLETVKSRVETELQKGQLMGPDGILSSWKVC